MADIIKMKRRGTVTDAKATAGSADHRTRSRKLLSLLDAMEGQISRDRQMIAVLRAEQDATAKDVRQLRSLLQSLLSLVEQDASDEPGLSQDQLERLVDRLKQMAATADRDRETVGADATDGN